MTTHSLPSTSSTLPLRTELAITFTTVDLSRFERLGRVRQERRQARHVSSKLALSSGLFEPRQGAKRLPPQSPSPWWNPENHADRRPFLLARGRILTAIRRWFSEQGFLEVDTSVLQISPGNEAHLQAFSTTLTDPDGARHTLYLHTSPEFACKKLLAAGEERIFTFAPVFRNRERSALHHPAFTMLEWYRAQRPYDQLMQDCADILRLAAEAAGTRLLCHGTRTADPFAQPERLSVADAFRRYAGIDLLESLAGPRPDAAALAAAATAQGVRVAED